MFTPFWWYEFDLGERNGRMTLRVQPREVVCRWTGEPLCHDRKRCSYSLRRHFQCARSPPRPMAGTPTSG